METFTIRDAAELCGVSYESMRKRVDRESVRAVKRDGTRRIPRSELERAGLWPSASGDSDELGGLREENEQLRAQVAEYRQLTERAGAAVTAERESRERTEQEFHRAVAERRTAEQATERAREETAELQARLDEIASAGPIRAFRLRRALRAERVA